LLQQDAIMFQNDIDSGQRTAVRSTATGSNPALRARRIASWLFPLPAVLVILLMMVFPVGYTFLLSFHRWFASSVTPPRWTGLENYIKLFTNDPRFFDALGRTLLFTLAAVTLQLILGIGMALLFNQNFRGRAIVRTLFLLPMVATPVAMSLIWLLIMNPVGGFLNWLLGLMGIPPGLWLSSAETVLPSLILIDTWQWSPLVMLMVLSGMTMLPSEPFEAAAIDGASWWQSFRMVMLPMLRPAIVVALLFRSIDALKTFDIIYGTTQGGPGFASETLNLYVYAQGFTYFELGYASTILVVFFTLVMSISVVFMLLRRRAEA
jgi:multiple sugar transport system permease protein